MKSVADIKDTSNLAPLSSEPCKVEKTNTLLKSILIQQMFLNHKLSGDYTYYVLFRKEFFFLLLFPFHQMGIKSPAPSTL